MPELRWILLIAGAVILFSIYWWGRRNAARDRHRETIVRSRAEPLISTDDTPNGRMEPRLDGEDEDISPAWIDETQSSMVDERTTRFDQDDDELEEEQAGLETARREPTVTSDFEADAALTTHASAHNEAASEMDDDRLAARAPQPEPRQAAAVQPEPAATSRKPTPRKIVVLRLASTPNKIAGDQLRAALASEDLIFGKYEIFHRLHPSGASLFSVASMVEPGSFDLARMETIQYPGVTLFMQLPAAAPGLQLFEDMLQCAKNLQAALGGSLQDDRGTLLNPPRLQRIRQEIVDFESLLAHADAT